MRINSKVKKLAEKLLSQMLITGVTFAEISVSNLCQSGLITSKANISFIKTE